MANIENIELDNIVYPLRDKNTYRSLTEEQAIHLDDDLAKAAGTTADGKYNGSDVDNNTIFTMEDGTFQKFTKTSNPTGQANFTIVGNPTITDGVASGFSGSDYLSVTETFDVDGKSWELEGSFITPEYTGNEQYFLGYSSPYNFLLGSSSSYPKAYLSDFELGAFPYGTTLQPNTKYFFVLSFDKDTSAFTYKVKEDGGNWYTGSPVVSTPLTSILPFALGTPSPWNQFNGSLGLFDYSLKIENSVAWTAYSAGWDYSLTPLSYSIESLSLNSIAEAGNGIAFTGGTPVTVQNFTVEGSPTITDGVASNFSKYNYLKANYHFDASDKPWKFSFKFTPTHVSGHDSIIGGEWNTLNESFMLIRLVSGKMLIMMTDLSNPSTNFINNTGTYSFTNNKTYYGEVGYDGTKYYSKYKQSGSDTWTPDMNITSSSLLNDGYFVIGTLLYSSSGSGGEYFQGSIDLNEFSVEIDNEVVWTPYTETPASKTTISATTMTGATGVVAGTTGMVPAPSATDNVKFLKGDGTWSEVKQLEAYQSLTAAQRTILLNNGTYDGKAVTPGTIFTQYDGTFQKFTKKQVIDETEFVDSGNTIPDGISYYVTKIDKNGTNFYMAIPIDNGCYGYTLTDGENWTSTNSIISSKREAHVGALYKNGVWVCEDGNSGFFKYSEDDGETWIESPSSPGTPTTQFSLEGDYFVTCFGGASPCYSANGKDWIQINSNMSDVYGITYDGTQWIAVTYSHNIYTNDDITNDNTWIEVVPQTAPICNSFYAVAYNGGIYYVYGAAYLNGTWCNIVETSPDLLNWTHSDKIFPDNDGWSGGYSKFICNGNFVAIEINNSMWYTLDQGSTWSDEIATHGHSTLIGNELWDVYEGTIYTFNTISHLGNILENISYNKSEVDILLNQRLRVIHGGNGINVELDGDAANLTYFPSIAYEAPTPQTWSYDGTLLTDMQNKKSYINMGYDSDTNSYIWKEVQTGSSATYDANTETIKF